MPGEAGQVIIRNIVAEVVEEQERIENGCIAKAERAAEMDAGAFESGFRFDELLDGSNGHRGLLTFCGAV
jgi:hypothetical protein